MTMSGVGGQAQRDTEAAEFEEQRAAGQDAADRLFAHMTERAHDELVDEVKSVRDQLTNFLTRLEHGQRITPSRLLTAARDLGVAAGYARVLATLDQLAGRHQ